MCEKIDYYSVVAWYDSDDFDSEFQKECIIYVEIMRAMFEKFFGWKFELSNKDYIKREWMGLLQNISLCINNLSDKNIFELLEYIKENLEFIPLSLREKFTLTISFNVNDDFWILINRQWVFFKEKNLINLDDILSYWQIFFWNKNTTVAKTIQLYWRIIQELI